jgi:transcriptional regulator with XRE-family HTH domain
MTDDSILKTNKGQSLYSISYRRPLMIMTRMKAARLERGWSQQELGFHARIAAGDISKIESVKVKPYPGHVARLCQVLGLSPEELLAQVVLIAEAVNGQV